MSTSINIRRGVRVFRAIRARYRLPFSMEAAAYLAASLAIASLGSYKAATAATYFEAVKWSQCASIVSQACLVWLVNRLAGRRAGVMFAFLTGAYAFSLIVHVASETGLFFGFFRSPDQLKLHIGQTATEPGLDLDLLRLPVDLANAAALVWVIGLIAWRSRRLGILRALLGCLLAVTVLWANLHDMYFVGPVYLAPYGLLLMLVVAFWNCYGQLAPRVPTPAEAPAADGSSRKTFGAINLARTKFLLKAQSPLLSTAIAMLLVSAAQGLGSSTMERVVILLVLVGMMQATIGVLYRGGSGRRLRQLTILALCALGLSQALILVQDSGVLPASLVLSAQSLVPRPLHDWLWILGLLLILSAIYFASVEVGDTRRKLVLEHEQLIGEVVERRKAEDELRMSEERFRTLIENCSDVIAVLDTNGMLLFAGTSVARVLGRAADDVVGKSVFEFCHPNDRRSLDRKLKRIAGEPQGTCQGAEIRVQHGDGSWRVMEGVGRNLLDDPVLKGIVVNARDITERKLMEERLELVRGEEQQRIRHDLHDTVGQDLAGLLCLAGGLARKLQDSPQGGTEQAEALIEGVRHTMADVRKAVQGIAPVEAVPRGLEVALRQLTDKARAQQGMDIQFECRAPVLLIDSATATQLFRIAQEALTNAIKHSQATRIVVSLLSDSRTHILVVEDNGIGMDSSRGNGAGMGLHTMQSRAAALGAVLNISESDSGDGTRVECILARRLPRQDADAEERQDFAI